MALKAIGVALAVLAAVPGCGMLKQTAAGTFLAAALPGGATGRVADYSRAQIEALDQPIIRVETPSGTDSLIGIRDRKGQAVAWEAADGALFTFRNGILIETRAMGADLMSSSAPSAAQIAAGGSHNRSYFITGENDRNIRHDFTCRVEQRGAAELVIYGRRHATRHLAEICDGGGMQFTNEYWFQGNAIRKSREWIGPEFGHLSFERVVD